MEQTDRDQSLHPVLAWLVSRLNHYGIPYQVVGGLAAQAYGATRPLVDIDLYIPFDQAQAFLDEIQPYMVRQPLPHRSEAWDLVYLALEYQNAYIEIGDSSAHPRFYNRIDQRWEAQAIDYAVSNTLRVYGVNLAVMPKAELIRYKTMLDREVDHQDIKEMNEYQRRQADGYI